MPEVVSDPGIIRENVPDLKKLSRSLIKIIADKYSFTDSNQLDFFLVFDSRENLSAFLVNHESLANPKTSDPNAPAMSVDANTLNRNIAPRDFRGTGYINTPDSNILGPLQTKFFEWW